MFLCIFYSESFIIDPTCGYHTSELAGHFGTDNTNINSYNGHPVTCIWTIKAPVLSWTVQVYVTKYSLVQKMFNCNTNILQVISHRASLLVGHWVNNGTAYSLASIFSFGYSPCSKHHFKLTRIWVWTNVYICLCITELTGEYDI